MATMTSLPLISHHLFVAAAGQEHAVRRKARAASSPAVARNHAAAVPLVLIDRNQPVPGGVMRAARVAAQGDAF